MKLRPASMADARRLFEWRNDPITREMSIAQDEVEWSSHVQWLARRLERDEPELFIAEVEGRPVGTVRFDNGEVSFTVAPEERGKGVATAMLKLAHAMRGPCVAKIKATNIASLRAAENAGHVIVVLPEN
jgi:RimJ/RimL family protein N-acetyltransferase